MVLVRALGLFALCGALAAPAAAQPAPAKTSKKSRQIVTVLHRPPAEVPSLGSQTAPVTIEFFANFGDGTKSAQVDRLLTQLYERHPRRLRVLYRLVGSGKQSNMHLEAAQEAFDQWESEGVSLSGPIRIQHDRADQRQIDVVQIIIDNFSEVGIQAEAEPLDSETYFDQLADGACQVCATGWIADYPTYDNFLNDLFYTGTGNNHGRYSNPEFDRLVDEAKTKTDVEEAGELFREAERVLLNDDVGALPINFATGDYAFNPDTVPDFQQRPDGIIPYETITVSS